jgi:hypothetical protein
MDWTLILCLSVLVLLYYGYQSGFFGKIKTYGLRGYVFLMLIKGLWISTTQIKTTFTPIPSSKCASILYDRLGTQYLLIVQYDRSKIADMTQFKAFLHFKGNIDTIDITQQPGIPYTVTANELGGSHIEITNMETGLKKKYLSDTKPMYADELFE